MLKYPVIPAALRTLIARLPVAPPSRVFSTLANRLLWPALQTLDWQPLVGRRYVVRITDLGLSLRFTVTARGFAPDTRSHHPGAPDLTISATARDFMLLLTRREDPDTLFFSRRLLSEGDTELGLTVKNLLDALDPEAVLRQLPKPLARAALHGFRA
ncbi:MAG: SCP2 domain-containing protein [Gammaproteobacteria bacterium]